MKARRVTKQEKLVKQLENIRENVLENPRAQDLWGAFAQAMHGLIKHSGDKDYSRDAIAESFQAFNERPACKERLPKLAFMVAEAAVVASQDTHSLERKSGYGELETLGAGLCALFLKQADMSLTQITGVTKALIKSKSAALQAIRFQPEDHEVLVSAQPWCSQSEIQGFAFTIPDAGSKPAQVSSSGNTKKLDLTAGW